MIIAETNGGSVPDSELSDRRRRLKVLMDAVNVDAVLLTTPQAIYYMSGFQSTAYYQPHALLLERNGRATNIVRDIERLAVEQCAWIERAALFSASVGAESVIAQEIRRLTAAGVRRIGYERKGNFLTLNTYSVISSAAEGAEFLPLDEQFDALRVVKSDWEIAAATAAGSCALDGMRAGLAAVEEGVAEKHVALEMLRRVVAAGSDFPASYPYVYFGSRSDTAMQQATDLKLKRGGLFYLECCAAVRRYGAVVLRTGCLGRADQKMSSIYGGARRAFEATEEALRPGATAGEIDRAARSVLSDRGLESYLLHRVGYSMGIGFAPGWAEANVFDIRPGSSKVILEGMVLHVLIILMLPGIGALGLSETFLTTAGLPVSLTPFSRDYVEVSL